MTMMLLISISALAGKIFSLDAVYVLTGVILFIFAAMTFADRSNKRRLGSGCFWLVLGIIFAFGGVMPYWLTGLLVLLMVAIDGAGRVGKSQSNSDQPHEDQINLTAPAQQLGNRVFIPVLAIPVVPRRDPSPICRPRRSRSAKTYLVLCEF